jgi:hypothetical protein
MIERPVIPHSLSSDRIVSLRAQAVPTPCAFFLWQ